METNLLLAYVAGVVSPIVLALSVKAIKRVPRDLRAYLTSVAGFIRS